MFTCELPLDSVVLDIGGAPGRHQTEHSRWIVATQDCDLDGTDKDDGQPTIELRPVFRHDTPPDWGIRSIRYRLTDTEHVHGLSPRTFVSAALLSAVNDGTHGGRDADLDSARQRGLKTWLGLRYDRPAVPNDLTALARRIASEVNQKRHRLMGRRLRDVLMQFDSTVEPVRFSLFAVLERPEDREPAREWLAEIATAIPDSLGIADQLDARAADGSVCSSSRRRIPRTSPNLPGGPTHPTLRVLSSGPCGCVADANRGARTGGGRGRAPWRAPGPRRATGPAARTRGASRSTWHPSRGRRRSALRPETVRLPMQITGTTVRRWAFMNAAAVICSRSAWSVTCRTTSVSVRLPTSSRPATTSTPRPRCLVSTTNTPGGPTVTASMLPPRPMNRRS